MPFPPPNQQHQTTEGKWSMIHKQILIETDTKRHVDNSKGKHEIQRRKEKNSDTSSRWAAARELAMSLDDDSHRASRLTALPAAAAAASCVELETEPTELMGL